MEGIFLREYIPPLHSPLPIALCNGIARRILRAKASALTGTFVLVAARRDMKPEKYRKRSMSNPSRSILAASEMPELAHDAGEPFDISKSAIAAWLAAQPEIRQAIFDYYREKGAIVFDKANGTWKGANRV